VLWKQESFVVLHPLRIEFFRNLLYIQAARNQSGSHCLRDATQRAHNGPAPWGETNG
jgi:hypothetical protein